MKGSTLSVCERRNDRRVQYVQEEGESVKSPRVHVMPEDGEACMVRRTMLQTPKEKYISQRRILFETAC